MEKIILLLSRNKKDPIELRKVVAYLRLCVGLGVFLVLVEFLFENQYSRSALLDLLINSSYLGFLYFLTIQILRSKRWAKNIYIFLIGLKGIISTLMILEFFRGFIIDVSILKNFVIWVPVLIFPLEIYAAYLLLFDKKTKRHFLK